MQTKLTTPTLATAIALLALGYGGAAVAHTQVQSLGKKASATDIYQVTCSDDGGGVPSRLEVEVQDLAPVKSPLVNARVQMGTLDLNTTDPKDGDKKTSLPISVNGGAGVYQVTVSKLVSKPGKPDSTRAFPEIYKLIYHCMTATSQHTGTDIVQSQNQ